MGRREGRIVATLHAIVTQDLGGLCPPCRWQAHRVTRHDGSGDTSFVEGQLGDLLGCMTTVSGSSTSHKQKPSESTGSRQGQWQPLQPGSRLSKF